MQSPKRLIRLAHASAQVFAVASSKHLGASLSTMPAVKPAIYRGRRGPLTRRPGTLTILRESSFGQAGRNAKRSRLSKLLDPTCFHQFANGYQRGWRKSSARRATITTPEGQQLAYEYDGFFQCRSTFAGTVCASLKRAFGSGVGTKGPARCPAAHLLGP
ncbi:MAG: hypothetical protein QXN56_05730 [Candidatus Hadarchaeum sp.]